MKKIAIFGGSFDPPHIAHEQIVKKVLQSENFQKLYVIPTFLSPFKDKYHLEPKDRFELLTYLFEDLSKVCVSDFEIQQNRAVPTIETIRYLKKLHGVEKISLVIGADNLKSIHLWNDFEELKASVELIVVQRKGYEAKNDIIHFKTIDMDIDISSTLLRENFDIKYIPKKIEQKVKKIWKKE